MSMGMQITSPEQGLIEGIAKFSHGEVVYFMQGNRIYKAKVKSAYEIDGLNTKYLVTNSTMSRWIIDHELYHSIEELFTDLKSCIVS